MRRTTDGWTSADYRQAIERLGATDLSRFHVILAANRAPVEHRRDPDGTVRARRGQGGLVTALASMVEVVDTTWVAAPLTAEDRQVATSDGQRVRVPMGARSLEVAFVPVAPDVFAAYYDDICNALLWFLQHGLTNAPEAPEFDAKTWKAWECYRQVNLAFAQAIAQQARRSERRPLVMIQDYHLFLVPLFLRRLVPDALIYHFTHIPWPASDMWRQLPASAREELLHGLLQCDVVGFHTPRYAQHFMTTCQELLGVDADLAESRIQQAGRTVKVAAYPISIDPDALRAFAESDAVRREERALESDRIHRTMNLVQVARTDPSKNLLRSLKALDLFLDRSPQHHGKVRFWGVLPASRQGCDVYRGYLERVKALADGLNRRHRRWGWQPVELTFENSYARGIACMKHYDVLLVNSLADGMNLVAKEGPVVNQRSGVLLLSETAGAWDELASGSIGINPYDLVGQADAFRQALTMPFAQRERLMTNLRQQIEASPVYRWVYDQLVDLIAVARPSVRTVAFYPHAARLSPRHEGA